MKRTIVITSGKGGVGKTTCCINLAARLAVFGQRVLIIDGDVGLRNLDLALGVQDDVVHDFGDVLEGNTTPQQALIKCKCENLYMLAAPQVNSQIEINPTKMKALCSLYYAIFDFIIIDCPAGIGKGFENAIAPADLALVITTPDLVANRDADRAIGMLESAGIRNQMLVINKVRGDLIRKGKSLNIDEIIDVLGIDALGIVPEDELVMTVARESKIIALNPKSMAAKAFNNIARRIMGEVVPLIKLKKRR
ncbi:site-determining protein [Clostridia bacterium]|nr:site-determining protein [Clostridia bacterium]